MEITLGHTYRWHATTDNDNDNEMILLRHKNIKIML